MTCACVHRRGSAALRITAHADEIRLVASNAVKELVHELIPAFEKASGHRVQVTRGGTPDITRLAEEGGALRSHRDFDALDSHQFADW